MRGMNLLTSMRYLVALNEHRHFGRAALACHITQPALSNALRALEQEFGIVIVRRGRVFAGFTAEGEQVLATALAMLKAEEALRQELSLCAVRADRACSPGPSTRSITICCAATARRVGGRSASARPSPVA